MKNRAYHWFLKTKHQYDYQMYAKYRNQSKNACRKAVTDNEKSLSKEVKSNPKAFFRYAKNKLNFKNAIPDLLDNGKILSDDTSKAKLFNMFFKSVFTEESDCLSDFNLNVKSSIEHISFPAEENLVIFRHPPPPCMLLNNRIKTIDVCFCLDPFSPPKSVHTLWMVPIRVSNLGLFQF